MHTGKYSSPPVTGGFVHRSSCLSFLFGFPVIFRSGNFVNTELLKKKEEEEEEKEEEEEEEGEVLLHYRGGDTKCTLGSTVALLLLGVSFTGRHVCHFSLASLLSFGQAISFNTESL